MAYETISYEKRDHVGVVTLDRPDALNAFNRRMEAELSGLWTEMRNDDDVWVAVLTAAGDRAFCVGVDTKESTAEVSAMSQFERWKKVPGSTVTARQNGCFKPVITAVNGMCGGGGLYFVADSDIVIAAENATFFDPHVTYGRVAAVEPIALTRRMPFGEVMRMALMGSAWRMSAERAYQVGLAQEVVPRAGLLAAAMEMAQALAELPRSPWRAPSRRSGPGWRWTARPRWTTAFSWPSGTRSPKTTWKAARLPRKAQAQLQEPLTAAIAAISTIPANSACASST